MVPSTQTGFAGHWNLKGLSCLCLHDPSHKALVFDGFNFRPERLPKLSNTAIALLTKLLLLLKFILFIYLKTSPRTIWQERSHRTIVPIMRLQVHLTPKFFSLVIESTNYLKHLSENNFEFARILDFLFSFKVGLEVLHDGVLGIIGFYQLGW